MKSGNKGLTVKVNLLSMNEYLTGDYHFYAQKARLWMKGRIENADTGKSKIFNDAGELISILGKWNTRKLQELRRIPKRSKSN